LAIVQQRIGELKEGIGADLLVRFDGLLKKVNEVAMGFAGEAPNSLSNKVKTLQNEMGYGNGKSGAYTLGESLREVADSFSKLFEAISGPAGSNAPSTLERLATALETVAKAINFVADGWERLQRGNNGRPSAGPFSWGLWGQFGKLLGNEGRAMGGSVRAGQAYTVGEFGKETFIPNTNGQIVPNSRLGGGNTTINLNGIIDAESARRAIERLLQDSGRRTAAINLVGSAF
jgi:hypothetical protein